MMLPSKSTRDPIRIALLASLFCALISCGTPSPPSAASAEKTQPLSTDSSLTSASSSSQISKPPPASQSHVASASPTLNVRSRLLGSRQITLPPSRPLAVSTRCNFANESGYKGDADIDVKNGIVQRMRIRVDVPEPHAGRCIFDMTGMVQTQSNPSVELVNRGTGCTARMWEQGTQAVVSFSNCASACSSQEAYKYVWPVLIDRSKNRCD